MSVMRRYAGAAMPLLFLAALAATYPLFSRAFTAAVSFARLQLGQLGTRLGVAPEARGVLLGIFKPEVPYSLSRLEQMESAIGTRFAVVSMYRTWGEREEDAFPQALMRAADEHGAMVMLTWEPWVTEFRRNRGRSRAHARTELREIADGVYDDYVRRWAREAAIFGRVFFLRFAHEMNNAQYPWSQQAGNAPADFIDAWRHVHGIFQEVGAKNVVWVWSPKGEPPEQLYPGGDYVDWIGTGVFNYGPFAEVAWHSFEYLYDPIYRGALRYEKPIMITEMATSPLGGNPAEWYAEAFEKLSMRYPETRAVVLYNNPADATLAGALIDWSVEGNEAVLALLRRHAERGMFERR